MDANLIFEGKATLEELVTLNQLGFEFVIEDGDVTMIIRRGWV